MQPDTTLLNEGQASHLNEAAFFGDIVAELAQSLEEVVGLADAEGYITTVGGNLGVKISDLYSTAEPAGNDMIGRVLVDLKARIGGEFKVVDIADGKITLTNSRCPFGDRVKGKPSLCMMTNNVFGQIVSDRNGYAHVEITEAIARGDKQCHVVVTLDADQAPSERGSEFFGR